MVDMEMAEARLLEEGVNEWVDYIKANALPGQVSEDFVEEALNVAYEKHGVDFTAGMHDWAKRIHAIAKEVGRNPGAPCEPLSHTQWYSCWTADETPAFHAKGEELRRKIQEFKDKYGEDPR